MLSYTGVCRLVLGDVFLYWGLSSYTEISCLIPGDVVLYWEMLSYIGECFFSYRGKSSSQSRNIFVIGFFTNIVKASSYLGAGGEVRLK